MREPLNPQTLHIGFYFVEFGSKSKKCDKPHKHNFPNIRVQLFSSTFLKQANPHLFRTLKKATIDSLSLENGPFKDTQ